MKTRGLLEDDDLSSISWGRHECWLALKQRCARYLVDFLDFIQFVAII